ncbi:MMT2 [Symbiodinium necroappetens]|nr:MMT2 [Symbiodinium necroappetens]
MDAALHLPAKPAALGFFSGSLMCRRRWRERLPLLKGWRDLALVQGHGRGDWAVGVNGGRWMRDFCRDEIGMQQAEYHEFQGGHTIPPDLADRFIEMLLRASHAAAA